MGLDHGNTKLRELLQRRSEELDILVDIGKTLTSTLDLQGILELMKNKVTSVLKPKAWSLLLMDEATEELHFEIVVSPVAQSLKEFRLKKGEGIAGWVALHGQPLLIPDVRKDSRFAGHIDSAVSFATLSIVCVPLKIKERVLGVIELINSLDEVQFNDADLKIISAIADYAAIAIENAKNYEKIRELVIIDDLTGLFNAKHFHKLLDYEFERARRYGTPLSLVFLDLDHFKNVNDTHGHLVGSRLLTEFGQLIKRTIRSTDLAARYGGDEFVIIVPNTPTAGTFTLIEKLRSLIHQFPFHSDSGERVKVTASFGIACYSDNVESKQRLIELADKAMYEVKQGGRDGIKVY